ncbi:organelle RRM domain-containing protein 6, chloroplastic-like [Magnolia sinica]|uniref:organelle RRM domain-containing protein 6, chloroplastic-like n=1 Tax=Magnolia sinica TaxID=86752 RepID=UPI00265A611F|nr:organelle RRM domain-containing protein 6, chloroplastic-like [Magnolia sinica]
MAHPEAIRGWLEVGECAEEIRGILVLRFMQDMANLTFDTSEEDLLRIFGHFGKLRDVFIPWNRQLNHSHGFTFIRFCYEQNAFKAIQCLHGRRIDGKVAHIDWAKGQSCTRTTVLLSPRRPKPGGSTSSGSIVCGRSKSVKKGSVQSEGRELGDHNYCRF